MSSIVIDGVSRDVNEINPGWIIQKIRALQEDGKAVYVQLTLDIDDANLDFASSAYEGNTSSVSRKFTDREQSLIDLWGQLKLGAAEVNAGKLVLFLKQAGVL